VIFFSEENTDDDINTKVDINSIFNLTNLRPIKNSKA